LRLFTFAYFARQRVRPFGVSGSKSDNPASDAEREEIFAAMEAIEALNPTAAPADSELLGGKWSLLYTGASAEDVPLAPTVKSKV